MTAPPKFGDAIAVEGVRPAWLPDGIVWQWKVHNFAWMNHGFEPSEYEEAGSFAAITAIRLEVPRYDFVYLALERGMVPNMGASKDAPADWDGGPYLCRDGKTYHMRGYDWGHGTHCDNETACWDRIGYTRKATSTALPLAQGGKLGWDADGMCDDHYRFACKECALPLAHPAAPQGEDSEVERLRAENERLRTDIRHIQRNTATYRQEARAEADRANARAAEANIRADNIAAANRTLLAAFENAPTAIASGREGAE